jgi:hypothetical protein
VGRKFSWLSKRQGGGVDQLLYSRADWEAPSSKGRRDGEGSSNSKRGENNDKGKGKGKPQGHGKGDRSNERKPQNLDMSKVKCYNCNEMGHYAKNCPEPNKREIKANLAKQEDDDPTILMAEVCNLSQSVVEKPNRKVRLQEKNFIPKLSGNQNMSWYLDGMQGEIPRART